MLTRTFHILILTAALAGAMTAETRNENDWANVLAIPRGAHIEVIDTHMKRSSGTLIDASADQVTVREGNHEQTVSRPDVARISAGGGSRRKHALIGLAAGAAAAAAVSAAARSRDKNSGNDVLPKGAVVAGATVGGAAVGALAGTALPSFHTVYRSEGRPAASR